MFREETLDNGLRIVAEIEESAVTAGMGFFVRTGARDEPSEIMGVSHFLEHMMFKGTERRSAEEIDRAFDDLGAEHNAFTTGEMTAFWTAGLPEVLPECQDILSDILRPSLRQEDFDAEKGVILEEIAMYDDQPFWVLYERTMEQCFSSSGLGHRVLGTAETITAMQRDDMVTYFEDRYSADNTIVAMSGKLDFDEMVDRVAALCGAWPTTGASRDDTTVLPQSIDLRDTSDDVHQHYLLWLMPGVPVADDRRYAAAALASILGSGDNSRFHWALVNPGLAEQASASIEPLDGSGLQAITAVCAPQQAEEVESLLASTMRDLVESLTEDDLLRVRNKAATAMAISSERSAGRMQRLGGLVASTGTYRSLEDELARIDALQLGDLKSVADAFPWNATVRASLSPA